MGLPLHTAEGSRGSASTRADVCSPDERVHPDLDIFLVEALDGYLLYNPLARKVALLSAEAGSALLAWRFNSSLKDYPDEVITQLRSSGILVVPSIQAVFGEQSFEWRPTDLIISVTQKCSLRCKYCYAAGGRLQDRMIRLEVAHAAIDVIVSNARDARVHPSLHFLGEGEATASWQRFLEIVEYFRTRCSSSGIIGRVALTTNGVFPSCRILPRSFYPAVLRSRYNISRWTGPG